MRILQLEQILETLFGFQNWFSKNEVWELKFRKFFTAEYHKI